MAAAIFAIIAVGVLAGCVFASCKLPKTKSGFLLKLILNFISGFIILWLIWLLIMVFGVGPAIEPEFQ